MLRMFQEFELPTDPWYIALYAWLAIVIFVTLAGNDAGTMSKSFSWQFRLAASLRTPILVFVVVPLSFASWCWQQLVVQYRLAIRGLAASRGSHAQRVKPVVDSLVAWNANGRKTKLRTARPNWACMSTKLSSNKAGCHLVPVTHLDHILDVDFDRMTVTVEPFVNMGMVTSFLLPKNFALEIQVEMESITVGGLAMGFGMETNSHTVGFFQESVVEYEIVSPDGVIHFVNKDSDPDFFYAIPWNYGTLGFLLSAKIRIVPVKEYVHMEYIITNSPEELGLQMTKLAEADDAPTFLEATIYTKNTAVIQCGHFVDSPKAGSSEAKMINCINHFWKPFYYKHVETFIPRGGGSEIIPRHHYYHRFTRSIFWEVDDMIPFANHPVYRCLWGWLGAPEVSLLKLFQGPVIRANSFLAHAVQESIMPIRKLSEGVHKFDDWFCVYPLLVFPLRVYDRGERSGFLHPRKDMLIPGKDYGLVVDLGAYGVPRQVKQGGTWDAKANVRKMEDWTRDLGGWHATYTDICCTHKEFRDTFDHTLVDKMRKRLNVPESAPSIFSKVKPEDGLIDLSKEIKAEGSSAVPY